MHPGDSISRYRVPDAPRPTLAFSRRGEGRVRSLAGQLRRRVRGRRLAYVDSHFPWQRSGFRYADALALHEARPDTVFFSLHETRDPFPAPVLPLAQFPRLAPSLGITDLYGVSPRFMAGALGLRDGLDLSGVLQREGIRTHVGLYPGEGFVVTEARRLVEAADQAFSWMPAALERLSGVTPIDPGVIDTAFYAQRPSATSPPGRSSCCFVADAEPHTGLAEALAAVEELAGEPVHLHVVGPHDGRRPPTGRRSTAGSTARGCASCTAVATSSSRDPATSGDGFPTAPAAEAVASGLLLLASNPESDHRHLRPGVDHIEVPATAGAYADAVRAVLADPGAAAAMAESGAHRVRERFDVRAGVAARLALMGFNPGRTPFARSRAGADTLAADLARDQGVARRAPQRAPEPGRAGGRRRAASS